MHETPGVRRGRVAPLLVAATLAACGPESPTPSSPTATTPAVRTARKPAGPPCDADNGGITLPAGFCAAVFADGIGAARHLAVRPNGDVYAAISDRPSAPGGVVVLRDNDGDGRADQRARFGDRGGNGVAWYGDFLYFAENERIVRFAFKPRGLAPSGSAVVVSGLPAGVEHVTKSIAFGSANTMYVNFGSASNSCQIQNRVPGSPGIDPCPELATRAGIWVGDPQRLGQTAADFSRFATGLRNTVALAVDPSGVVFGVQMDRDNLSDNWPTLFSPADDVLVPAEELVRIESGADFGWPYCYYDGTLSVKLLAPEYGGDRQIQGRCAGAAGPSLALPAHWAPMSMVFYTGAMFPQSTYAGGAFVAFHGDYFWGSSAHSERRGYNVVFVPFDGGAPVGGYTVFADGFAGPGATGRATAIHRPTGLAVAPDGALLIADDVGGRIWRVVYRGP